MSVWGSVADRLSAMTTGWGLGLGKLASGSGQVAGEDALLHGSSSTWGKLLGLQTVSMASGSSSGPWQLGFEPGFGDLRNRFYWIIAVLVLLFVAAVTNPNESSFRTHLTELSFRRHLGYFRSDDDASPTPAEHDELLPETNGNASAHKDTVEMPPIAPFRFANHVSLCLRTPPLQYKTMLFFSLAFTSPLAPPMFLPDLVTTPLGRKHCSNVPRENVVLFIGYFGHWVNLGMIPRKAEWMYRLAFTDGKDKGRKKSVLERPGVLGLRAISQKDETLRSTSAKSNPSLSPIPAAKLLFKSDSGTSLADTPGLSAHPPINVPPFVPESRRSSIVNLVAAAANAESIDALTSPLISGLKAELATAQSALTELQAQLLSHEETVSRAHSNLQATLDELRSRRKEDDAERQELKSKSKNLDEQKRQAEAAKREAEKRLRAAEVSRDGLQGKIASASAEVQHLRVSMDGSRDSVRALHDVRSQWVEETRGSVEGKRVEMEGLEEELTRLDQGNQDLSQALQEAEENIAKVVRAGEEAKSLGPEEEMMMMAAAYEAAAQEGYSHAPNPHGPHPPPNMGQREQWANQAAAYMAEAGMPYLDQNYTARPQQSATFGHLAQVGNDETRPREGLREIWSHDKMNEGQRVFGAGRPVTPSDDSGSDVWGHDPGSPNGGISSSFSANLLPQGLFQSLDTESSLGGDDAGDEEGNDVPLPTSQSPRAIQMELARTLSQGSSRRINQVQDVKGLPSAGSGDHEEGSDSSASDQGFWRSPQTIPAVLKRHSGDMSGRLMPPASSTTPPGMPPGSIIPNLPVPMPLTDSRRWLSGTSSAENLGLPSFSTSNESLPLMGGPYEFNPFAPSASEKKVLALKLPPWSKTWTKPFGRAPMPGVLSTLDSGIARISSNSIEYTSSSALGDDKAMTSGGSPGNPATAWFSARFSSNNMNNLLKSSISNDDMRASSLRDAREARDASPDGIRGAEQGVNGEAGPAQPGDSPKRPFRFFSLRRPTSSGQGSAASRESKDGQQVSKIGE